MVLPIVRITDIRHFFIFPLPIAPQIGTRPGRKRQTRPADGSRVRSANSFSNDVDSGRRRTTLSVCRAGLSHNQRDSNVTEWIHDACLCANYCHCSLHSYGRKGPFKRRRRINDNFCCVDGSIRGRANRCQYRKNKRAAPVRRGG